MFYVKEKFGFDDITVGGRQVLDLDDRKIHFTCPGCGKKMKMWARQILEDCYPTEDGDSAFCPACSEKIWAERKAAAGEDDFDREFFDGLIDEFCEEAVGADGVRRMVYLRDRGIIVDIETCTDRALLAAAITQLRVELTDTETELAKVREREIELENAQYRVVWNDREGNEQERRFRTLRSARMEADDLKKKYDGVMVLDSGGRQLY